MPVRPWIPRCATPAEVLAPDRFRRPRAVSPVFCRLFTLPFVIPRLSSVIDRLPPFAFSRFAPSALPFPQPFLRLLFACCPSLPYSPFPLGSRFPRVSSCALRAQLMCLFFPYSAAFSLLPALCAPFLNSPFFGGTVPFSFYLRPAPSFARSLAPPAFFHVCCSCAFSPRASHPRSILSSAPGPSRAVRCLASASPCLLENLSFLRALFILGLYRFSSSPLIALPFAFWSMAGWGGSLLVVGPVLVFSARALLSLCPHSYNWRRCVFACVFLVFTFFSALFFSRFRCHRPFRLVCSLFLYLHTRFVPPFVILRVFPPVHTVWL